MTPNRSRYWKKGAPVKSIKALNASVASSLPKSNERISMCIALFTRQLLGFNDVTKIYPSKPTTDELDNFPNLNQQAIISDQNIFITHLMDVDETNQSRAKAFFEADLHQHGISRTTFDWSSPDHSQWNQTMAVFIAKHWLHSKQEGFFSNKGINPRHCTEEICIGLVRRWVRGRSEEIQTGRRSPEKILQKEKTRKKQMLYKYRFNALGRLVETNASELMPDSDCCSETDWQPEETHYNTIGLIWRSSQYTNLLHLLDRFSGRHKASVAGPVLARRRFDQCRTAGNAINQDAPVCCGLPENCYDPVFLSNLTRESKAALRIVPPSNLLNTLPPKILASLR